MDDCAKIPGLFSTDECLKREAGRFSAVSRQARRSPAGVRRPVPEPVGQSRIGLVRVKHGESAWWTTEVATLGHRLRAETTAFAEAHDGAQPNNLSGNRFAVNFGAEPRGFPTGRL